MKTLLNPVRNQVVHMLNVQYVNIPSKYEKVTTLDRNLDAIAQINIQYIETDTQNALHIKQPRGVQNRTCAHLKLGRKAELLDNASILQHIHIHADVREVTSFQLFTFSGLHC